MIHKNDAKDIAELKEIYLILQKVAAEKGVALEWQEIKGTIYFFPKLPAE